MSMPPRRASGSHVSPRRPDGSRAPGLPRIGKIAVTPFRALVALAFVIGVLTLAWAIIKVRDSSQIPMVASGFALLGIAFAAVSANAALRMWQAWRAGLQGQTLLLAGLGGVAGMFGLGCLAGALVLSLVWGS